MKSGILAAAVALAAPLAARAEPRVEIGLRTGFTAPLGDITGGALLSDQFHGFVPLGVELGVRYTPELSAVLGFTYAVGLPNNCPPNVSCSGREMSLGLDLRYHPRPRDPVAPWIGIGAGFEWLHESVTAGGASADLDVNGFEYVHTQMGVDFAVGKARLGPFFQFGLGQYHHLSASAPGFNVSQDITDKELHHLLTFGLRVSFLP